MTSEPDASDLEAGRAGVQVAHMCVRAVLVDARCAEFVG